MSPQRIADAATVSPYTYATRQERAEPSSAEPADRPRPARGKKSKARPPRPERNLLQEEDPKFNTGPRNLRTATSNRTRRVFRMPGRVYPEDQNGIPDYPPPSFLEAINTPPLSVCSSTTSLVQASATTIPLAFPQATLEHIPEDSTPQVSDEVVATAADNEVVVSENNDGSESDDSMCIIDMNSIPVASTDIPRTKNKTDWRLRRRGDPNGRSTAESPSKASDNPDVTNHGRAPIKLPPLEIDPNPTPEELDRPRSPATPKRRFLSLLPLRTIFPAKSPVHHDRAMSAHPSPTSSPYSISRATFFRSSSSLATSFLPSLPSLSNNKSEALSRKIFAHKGKHRSMNSPEELNAWEYLNEEEAYAGIAQQGVEHPASLMSAVASFRNLEPVGTSPTRSQSFTFGAQILNTNRPRQQFGQSTDTIQERPDHPLRDWKGPSTAFIDRTVNRRSPISPSTTTLASNFSGNDILQNATMSKSNLSLPLTPVRGTPSSPSLPLPLTPKRTVHAVVHPSPLRVDAKPNLTISNQATISAVLWQKALETPLPDTPVYQSHFDYRAGDAVVGVESREPLQGPAISASSRLTPDLLTNSTPIQEAPYSDHTPPTRIKPLQISIQPSPIPPLAAPTTLVTTSSLEEPMTPTRHHYSGRPLPRPPASTNRTAIVDSTYASPESSSRHDTDSRPSNICPEGLLIDLEDTTLDYSPATGASTPRSEQGHAFHSQYHLPMASRNPSSVELAPDAPTMRFDQAHGHDTPLRSPSPGPNHVSQRGEYSELTDLDLLISRLADEERDGSDYETLLLVSELIGPANLAQARGPLGAFNQGLSPTPYANSPSVNTNTSLIGRIEVTRRRMTQDGRFKLKIKLFDIAVDKCGICLSQFKHDDMAVLTSICQHSFHEGCVDRWLARAQTCPLCRVPLDADVR